MSDISKINVGGETYSLKDTEARSSIEELNESKTLYTISDSDYSQDIISSGRSGLAGLKINNPLYLSWYNQSMYQLQLDIKEATTDNSGIMTSDDKAKLDSIEEGATSGGDTVTWSQNITSGTKIATVTINGSTTSVYAPSSSSSSDTLNTTGTSNKTSTKMYLVGGTSQSSSTITYSNSYCYIGSDNKLYSNGSSTLTTSDTDTLEVYKANKLGSSSIGSSTQPIYLNSGTPTASESTVGSSTTPIYLKGGTMTACSYNINKTVPSDAVFTDTTYSAGTGLSLSGTTINHTSSITAGNAGDSGNTRTLNHGGTFVVPYISYNSTGHITSVTNKTLTLPSIETSTTSSLAVGATGTTTDANVTSPYLKLIDDGSVQSNVRFTGGTNMTVTSDSSKVITISTSATADSAIPTSTITSLCASILV